MQQQTNLPETATRKPPLFYGWIIVAIGFVNLTIAFGIWYSFSVFFLAIIDEFGWSRAATSGIFSVFMICQAMMGIITGHLQDRFGPRWVIPCGAVLLAAALVLTSRAQELWHFYLIYGILAGTGVNLIGFTSHSAFLPKWFERKRGLAVGIAMAGIGFGMMLVVPVLETLIALYDWRIAYQFAAAGVLLILVPLNLVFARRSPADMNLVPDGDVAGMDSEVRRPKRIVEIIDKEWAARDWTLKSAVRTRRFWSLVGAFFFISFAYQGTLLHSVSAMVDGGLTRQIATMLFGILGIIGSGGKILFGQLSDMYGRERMNTMGGLTAAIGIICLIGSGSGGLALAVLFVILFGIGYGSAAPMLPSVSADIFSGRAFGIIFAMIGIGGGLGGSCGPFVAGLIHDLTDSYTLSLSISIISLTISCSLVWIAGPGRIRKVGGRQPVDAQTSPP